MNRNVILAAVAVILLAVAVYLLWPKGGGTAAGNYGGSGPSPQEMTRIMQQEMNEAQRARMQTGGVPR